MLVQTIRLDLTDCYVSIAFFCRIPVTNENVLPLLRPSMNLLSNNNTPHKPTRRYQSIQYDAESDGGSLIYLSHMRICILMLRSQNSHLGLAKSLSHQALKRS